jgi:protein-S-isoprenylcysteine O-methyltransferase Ste14
MAALMKTAYFVPLVLCLIGLGTRTTYEILKKHGKVDTNNKGIFAVVFTGMFFILASWPAMCPLDPWRLELPFAVRGVGCAIAAIGAGLAVAGLIQLKGLENIDHLVTTGLYSKLRHPMYTGFIVWIAGWVILFGAGLSFLVGLVGCANILSWRHLEENKLAESYGDAWRKYRAVSWF